MKKRYESKTANENSITNMYSPRKPSYLNSKGVHITDEFDLSKTDDNVQSNSFKPFKKVDEVAKSEDAENVAVLDTKIEEDTVIRGKDETDNNSTKLSGKSNDSSNESSIDENTTEKTDPPTTQNDNMSVISDSLSITESERTLFPMRKNAQPLSEHNFYDAYIPHRSVSQQQLYPMDFIQYPDSYYLPHFSNNSQHFPIFLNQQKYGYQHRRSVTPDAYSSVSGQVFFDGNRQQGINWKTLHPQTARKISSSSRNNRFRQPVLPTGRFSEPNSAQLAKPRNRRPNHRNHGIRGITGQANSGRITRPISMNDLRSLEKISRNQSFDQQRIQSVEDIITVHMERAPSEISISSSVTSSRKKRAGMCAQSLARR